MILGKGQLFYGNSFQTALFWEMTVCFFQRVMSEDVVFMACVPLLVILYNTEVQRNIRGAFCGLC